MKKALLIITLLISLSASAQKKDTTAQPDSIAIVQIDPLLPQQAGWLLSVINEAINDTDIPLSQRKAAKEYWQSLFKQKMIRNPYRPNKELPNK